MTSNSYTLQDKGDKGDGTYGEINDKSLRIATPKSVPNILRIDMNPRVSIVSFVLIWAFILWCILYDDAGDDMAEAKTWITDCFTWFYVGSQDVWALFMIYLYFSKYGNLKLGKDDDEPEYPTLTWFTMLFACGIGVGLFYYGVAEPVFHYTGSNRYSADPYLSDNTLAQEALNLTFYHWGIHGWIVYSIVGCLLGIMVFRHGLPMKMSSCFYPILGDKVFGWVGDLIDTTSIITTLFGVCTSLGLGVAQINQGLHILNNDIPVEEYVQVIIIWVITACATCSTLSGMDLGIRRLSEICFALGMLLMTLLMLLEDPVYLLNVFTQSCGYYMNWILQLGTHCDAFEMHSRSAMGKDRGRINDSGTDGPSTWMDGWTIFYWGWWIAWSPFVGIFIAKISKGRTIREFVNGTMTAPILYTFLWMAIFGGAGIGMERHAALEGYCCSQNLEDQITLDSDAVVTGDTSAINASDFTNFCNGTCNTCSENILNYAVSSSMTVQETYNWVTSTSSSALYSRSSNKEYVRLSCFGTDEMWFYLMESHGDLGQFLDVLSLIAIILYFVTSSDSGSYIIDTLGSNGDLDPPRLQRLFWSLTEGGAATALVVAGGPTSLTALQTVSIAAGLPYTVVLCFVCVALYRACQVAYQDLDANHPDFPIGYLDFATEFKLKIIGEWFLGWILGPFWAARSAAKCWEMKPFMGIVMAIAAYLLLFLFVVFHFLVLAIEQFWALSWTCFFAFAAIMGAFRTGVRGKMDYIGNPVEDFFAGLFLYPSVGQQLRNYDPAEYERNNSKVGQSAPPPPYNGKPQDNRVYDNEEP